MCTFQKRQIVNEKGEVIGTKPDIKNEFRIKRAKIVAELYQRDPRLEIDPIYGNTTVKSMLENTAQKFNIRI